MPAKKERSSFHQRLADFTSRVNERWKAYEKKRSASGQPHPLDSVFSTLRDLFTRDITPGELSHWLHRDTPETFRFFTREIDFDALRLMPWYKRYPLSAWRVFVALAYRLTPPRRIAFAVATLAFLFGLMNVLSFRTQIRQGQVEIVGPHPTGAGWWLIAIAILFLLLLMELRDKLSLKGDLEIAREIQLGLVPSGPFEQDRMTIHGHMRPANTVGGDYYDIIELGKNTAGIVMGDVSGKGMSAALLMALLQGSLRTLLTAGHRGPELISQLNAYLYANIPAHSLVTLFYGELNTVSGELSYVNAGHNAPFLIRADQTFERLPATSIVLGIDKNSPFETQNKRIHAGDRLLLFTDGVSEAFNVADEDYGEARLEAFLRSHMNASQEELLQALMADVLNFCGSAKPGDDMTLMLVACHPRPIQPPDPSSLQGS